MNMHAIIRRRARGHRPAGWLRQEEEDRRKRRKPAAPAVDVAAEEQAIRARSASG